MHAYLIVCPERKTLMTQYILHCRNHELGAMTRLYFYVQRCFPVSSFFFPSTFACSNIGQHFHMLKQWWPGEETVNKYLFSSDGPNLPKFGVCQASERNFVKIQQRSGRRPHKHIRVDRSHCRTRPHTMLTRLTAITTHITGMVMVI